MTATAHIPGHAVLHERINDVKRVAEGDEPLIEEMVDKLGKVLRGSLKDSRVGSGTIFHVVLTVEDNGGA